VLYLDWALTGERFLRLQAAFDLGRAKKQKTAIVIELYLEISLRQEGAFYFFLLEVERVAENKHKSLYNCPNGQEKYS
jgi:hypothetical protein